MMRRRTSVALLAAVLLAGLVAVPGAPAGAQNGDSMLDAPRLGFEIDPTQGNVGDEVAGQVDPADVEEHCVTTVEGLQESFGPMSYGHMEQDSPVPPDNNGIRWQEIIQDIYDLVPPDDPIAFMDAWIPFAWQFFYPLPPAPQYPLWFGEGPTQQWWYHVVLSVLSSTSLGEPFNLSPEQYVARLIPLQMLSWVSVNALGVAEQVLPETFVLTFVDPVTQEMVGDMGSFDSGTGHGSVEVPAVEPGLWAVAAACIEIEITEERVVNAVNAAIALYEHYDLAITTTLATFCVDPFGLSSQDPECEVILLEAMLGAVIAELAVPRALGIDFYCILNEDGFCATPPDPVGLIDEDVLEEFNGDGPGGDPLAPGPGAQDGDDAGDLVAVQATPSFTG